MPLNNEYKRYFIILQEDDKGYEMAAGKIPTGYAKIEIKNGKGKLTAYAQNVKSGDKVDYRMLLIAPAKKAAVDMGRIMVDASGRGELNVEFDADNVLRSGMDISEFMVAAVQTNTAIPLSGYTGREKVQWKNTYQVINKQAERIDKKQQVIEEVVVPVQPKPIDVVQPITQVIPEDIPETPAPNLQGVGEFVENVKDVVGNVVEGAKDVVENVVEVVVEEGKEIVGNVVEGAMDVVEDVAKDIVGGVKKTIKDVVEFVVEENAVQPAPVMPIVEAPVTPTPIMPIAEAPVTPAPEEQIVVQPIIMQPIMQPVIENTPAQPAEIKTKKPLFETETEIQAKFVIEQEHHKVYEPQPHHKPICEVEKSQVDYKDFYYYDDQDKDSDCDSDSDSDSDDRDKKKKKAHKEECEYDYDKNPFYASPMYRRLEKVLGRLREYEPFDDDDTREKWFKVEDDIYLLNSATMPFMGSMMPLGYPFMSNECVMMIGRKDYIIGVKYDKGRKDKKYIKAVMFGVPGMYNKQEEVYYRMRGFMHFRPHKSKGYGYWIMAVDVRTGEILMK